jgi:hypothetical protein
MLLRSARQGEAALLDQQVPIGRSHMEVSGTKRLAMYRVRGRQGPGSLEDARQDALVPADVQHDKQRTWELARQHRRDGPEGLHAAGRGAHDDDASIVVCRG